ncbi:phospholipid carrier-dependent glycosyltransferase [Streptomyces sp. NPDC002928]|uniref:phospholipid carrier-dependent glycosyltransferase n=1 Tax=Streptomyces sp. NPDC002928 TaxID=3154440 RepID=UPI0033A9C80A
MMASEQQAVVLDRDEHSAAVTSREPAGRLRRHRRWLRRHRRWLLPLVVAVLLAQMAVAMVTTAVRQTPTIDEPVYVGTAAVYLREHSLRYNPEHPPLGKLVIAVGVALADPHVDTSFAGDQGQVGRHLLYESGNDPWRLMLWARLPVIALTLLFGLAVFGFARDLVGAAGGVAALALYTFSPDVIAHGSLATLDAPATGFLLTSVWLLWRARRRALPYLPLAGVALGAALATKMTALPAVPVLLALAAVSLWHGRPADRRRALLRAASAAGVVALAAVAVVWAAYLVVDPRLRWTSQQHIPAVHGLRGLLVHLLPFPEAYRDGMRIQFGFENEPWQGFLFGRLYTGSLWYYLPVALLVKTPLGMLALWAAGGVALVTVRRLRPAAPYLLAPTAVLLAAAVQGSRNFGTRYALFMPVFLAVAAGCVLAVRWRWGPAVTGALVLFVAVSSLRTYPFYLPYSNEAFGGPARTHLRLHDSNVDWGQDLGRLADRLRERYPGERIWLVYKGSGVPSFYGIHASDPRTVPARDVHGLLVVSDSAVAKAKGRLAELVDGSRAVDEVGHSITIYRR